jgi:hypothetical protein
MFLQPRKKLHGWSPRSTTPAIYEHLTDDDAVNAALRGHGIAPPEETEESFEPVECAYCHESNPSTAKFCHYCGVLLGEEGRHYVEAREKKTVELETLLKRIEKLEKKIAKEGIG